MRSFSLRLPQMAVLAAFAGTLPALASSPSFAADALSEAQRAEVKTVVREYLIENPEVIAEAINVLRDRQEKEEMERSKTALTANADALFKSKNDPVLGNPNGDVTLVEFFDYRCGYCKAAAPDVTGVVKSDGNVRLVLKELPILGPDSITAARWSLAARTEKAYPAFHMALMNYRGTYTTEALTKLAVDTGLDAKKIAAAADSDDVTQTLKDTMQLARELGINGTPAFIIGEHLIPGKIGPEDLKELITATRKDAAKAK